ncbi:imidazolonepropionase [Algoriphagus kandeliae]|uniref:Imidazolonepropionase n=1 Tax=Algoriphagus kandeliae TaxID=2562278 RepID=A0A4Y9QQS7_9BACT|nr:imidazolonepropionase [Algoriphagus kandeliae]TFV94128.1 imidazolonepropionase [Algoriphagus kandeliae]
MKNQQLIGPISQLITLNNLPLKGAISDEQLEIIPHAGIWIKDDQILEVGSYESLRKKVDWNETARKYIEGNYVALPGLVDCHTHICFGGSRAKDFAMRNEGKSYLEIAESGGGIWDTVKETRALSANDLAKVTQSRAERHLAEGVTTIEVKSGYGLSISEEIKMLSAIQKANNRIAADLIPTCLAAHTLPKDWEGSKEEYIKEITEKLLPLLQKQMLCKRVDAFVEKSAFSPEEVIPYFQKAKELGFDITVHADQFSVGGSALAVKLGAISADHLEASGEKEIELLAKSNTISVALPGASLGLGCGFTPARKILDRGGSLAIASDWNPGSAPMGDLLTQASILATFEKLGTAEVFAGITFRAAAALGLQDRGRLAAGQLADFVLFPTSDYREILYQQGKLKPEMVWKSGKKVTGKSKD